MYIKIYKKKKTQQTTDHLQSSTVFIFFIELNKYKGIEPLIVKGLVRFLLFNGISTFVGYLMPKPFSKKNSSGTIQPIAGRIRGFIPFPRVFAQK